MIYNGIVGMHPTMHAAAEPQPSEVHVVFPHLRFFYVGPKVRSQPYNNNNNNNNQSCEPQGQALALGGLKAATEGLGLGLVGSGLGLGLGLVGASLGLVAQALALKGQRPRT